MVLMTPFVTESFDSTVEVCAQSQSKKKKQKKSSSSSKKSSKKSSSKSKSSKKSSSKKSTSKKSSGSKSKSKSKGKSKSPTTSADAKKQQQKAQQEIKLTKQQIEENERLVKKSLNSLNSIKSDILVSEKQIAELSQRETQLSTQLTELDTKIAENEAKLAALRDNYLKVVKKMRLVKGKTDGLSFVFASKSFSQAIRRIRYLREFSKWREEQVAEISGLQTELKSQHEKLAQTKAEIDEVLAKERTVRSQLVAQRTKQDALVDELQRNGVALNSHLQKKQQEVNDLKSKIANLIAAEQRAAEEKRRKEEEAQRKAAEEKARQEAERQAQEEQKRKDEESKKKSESADKKKSADKKESTDKKKSADKKKDDGAYAEARKRKKRSDDTKKSEAKKDTKTEVTPSGGSFESMKGALPRPVSGAFKVVVPFGRHALPDLPSVEYDNPGIDAEVSAGASALAVFAGEVSGVYVLKGFDTVVIVNHGSYYTVYGNIATPAVKVGDKVKAGQSLGKLFVDTSDDNRTVIHFEVWKGREKLNPMSWIK